MKLRYIIMGLLALFLISPLIIMGYVVLLMGGGAFTEVQLGVAWCYFLAGWCAIFITGMFS